MILPEFCTKYLLRLEAPRYDTWCKIQVIVSTPPKEFRPIAQSKIFLLKPIACLFAADVNTGTDEICTASLYF